MKKDPALIEELKAMSEGGEELDYYLALLLVINDLPTKPPQHFTEKGFETCKAIWKIILKRGSKFLEDERR